MEPRRIRLAWRSEMFDTARRVSVWVASALDGRRTRGDSWARGLGPNLQGSAIQWLRAALGVPARLVRSSVARWLHGWLFRYGFDRIVDASAKAVHHVSEGAPRSNPGFRLSAEHGCVRGRRIRGMAGFQDRRWGIAGAPLEARRHRPQTPRSVRFMRSSPRGTFTVPRVRAVVIPAEV